MAGQNEGSEQVATQVATSTGTGGGFAGNDTTGSGSGKVSSPTPVVAPKGFRSDLQRMLQGWQEVIPSDSTVTSSAGSLTEAAVLAQLQGYLAAYADLDTHVTATRQARAQVESQLQAARKYYSVLKAAVTNLFGAESPQLVQFGLEAKKARAKLTSEQLAVRAAKARATRALRGTQGPVKKQDTVSGPMEFTQPVPKSPQWATAEPEGSTPSSAPVSAASPPGQASSGAEPAAGK